MVMGMLRGKRISLQHLVTFMERRYRFLKVPQYSHQSGYWECMPQVHGGSRIATPIPQFHIQITTHQVTL
jgi:hypothetical protein